MVTLSMLGKKQETAMHSVFGGYLSKGYWRPTPRHIRLILDYI